MTDRFSLHSWLTIALLFVTIAACLMHMFTEFPEHRDAAYWGLWILGALLLADAAKWKFIEGPIRRWFRRTLSPSAIQPHLVCRAQDGIEPFAFLTGTPPDPVSGAERRVRTDLFDERQDIRHLEVRVAVPEVGDQERQNTANFENAPPNVEAIANRCATVDIIGGQYQPVVQVMLWANGVVQVTECPEEGETKKHPPLFDEGELDLSRWVTVTIDWFGEQGRVIVKGDKARLQPLSARWPRDVQVHLCAVSWTVAPVAAFSEPRAW